MSKYEELMLTMRLKHMRDMLDDLLNNLVWTDAHRDSILRIVREIDEMFKRGD